MTFGRVSTCNPSGFPLLGRCPSCTYSLYDRSAGTTRYTNTACRLHEVRRADVVARILLILGQEEVTEPLHRIVDLARILVVAEEEGAVCTAAGRLVWVVLRGVSGWEEVVSYAMSQCDRKYHAYQRRGMRI